MLTALLFWRAFCKCFKVMVGTMAPMEVTNRAVGTWVCSHWLCPTGVSLATAAVGVMAAHGVSQVGFFATSHPSPHFAPPPIPLILSISNTDSRKGWHEIQPSEIKVRYNKNQYITKYFTAQHTGTMQSWGRVFVTEYFKMIFLEIPLGVY